MRLRWPWAVLVTILPLLGWWTYGLFDIDEGFYAAIAAEMNRRGEWVTPYLNGRPWFEKPILLYWLAKPSILLFGEFGARLPSILATFFTTVLIGWFLRRSTNERVAVWGSLAYGTSLLVVATGRQMMTDALLVLCLTAALLAFWESLVGSRAWRLATALALGLAVLAKGPVAGILFVLIAGIGYWRLPLLRPAYRGGWVLGTVVFLVVVASWYVPAYLANGSLFVDKFLIEQNIGRFTGGDAAHSIGWIGLLIYPLVLVLGMLPWSLWTFRGLFRGSGMKRSEDLETYLRIWFWVVVLFFSISGAKLPHYILPAAAPLAMLAAMRLEKREAGVLPVVWALALWAFVQWAFSFYYYGGTLAGERVPGFHNEVHQLGAFVREQAGPDDTIAIYQMSRRDKSLGTGKPKIQETSHPSLLYYLDREVLDTDEFGKIEAAERPVWIITRWNRMTPEQEHRLERVQTPVEQDLYALYRLR